ncbi:5-aminolevulinate synthase [Allostreptomyces psammosilenae]|uniref:8-amino-7-oxononanoate synthase n=1 Tax=Allostreptomyces psammosilenae TaxID=1892865 RepID=A0A853A271_9ACTN|nr:5-aminolevulinate synthase [Allostreptomyces psammosilenae]NYI04538.1 5-aminolevulinate synthase [Allostreptomyces psammosilenae]
MDVLALLAEEIEEVRAQGRYRTYLDLERDAELAPRARLHAPEGVREISVWCSNDYLALSHHPAVIEAVADTVRAVGLGTGGARSISGTSVHHRWLEAELADWYGKEAALLFSTGFTANDATLSALGQRIPGLVVFSDELNHASIIQGVRHSRAAKRIFRHNDTAHLRQLLAETDPDAPKLVVFESLYSMEGDFAPLAEIVEIAEEAGALTYLDEVHAVGIYGEQASGRAEELGLRERITVIQGGFGKGLGGAGGYIAAPRAVVDLVRSFAVPFVFSTSAPAALVAGALAGVRRVREDDRERRLLAERCAELKAALADRRIPVVSRDSHIVPVLVGDPHRNKRLSALLLEEHDIYVQPVNAPTVPAGTERLRVTPTSRHTAKDVETFVEALDTSWTALGLPREG